MAIQYTWFIDPVSGNDSNTGVDSTHAIKTWAHLLTKVPGGSVLTANMTITFMNSQPNAKDPVYISPAWILDGYTLLIQGSTKTATASTMSTVTLANPATNQCLQFTHPSGTINPGLLLVDTTSGGVCITGDALSATSNRLGTMFAPQNPLTSGGVPTIVNPSAGDSFYISPLVNIYVGDLNIDQINITGTNQVVFYRLQINGPSPDLFAAAAKWQIPVLLIVLIESIVSAFFIDFETGTGIVTMSNCACGTADLAGLTLLNGNFFVYGGCIQGEYVGSFNPDYGAMLTATTTGTIEIHGPANSQIYSLWSFSESWIRHIDNAVRIEIYSSDQTPSGTAYWAGQTTEFGISLEDGAQVYCYVTGGLPTLNTILYGRNTNRDINLFPYLSVCCTFDTRSSRFVNFSNDTSFNRLLETIDAGGWGGNVFSPWQGSSWILGGTDTTPISCTNTGAVLPKNITDANYTMLPLDQAIVVRSVTANRTVTLNTTVLDGTPISVSVEGLAAGTQVSVNAGTGCTIAGLSAYNLTINYTTINLVKNGTVWTIVGGKFS